LSFEIDDEGRIRRGESDSPINQANINRARDMITDSPTPPPKTYRKFAWISYWLFVCALFSFVGLAVFTQGGSNNTILFGFVSLLSFACIIASFVLGILALVGRSVYKPKIKQRYQRNAFLQAAVAVNIISYFIQCVFLGGMNNFSNGSIIIFIILIVLSIIFGIIASRKKIYSPLSRYIAAWLICIMPISSLTIVGIFNS